MQKVSGIKVINTMGGEAVVDGYVSSSGKYVVGVSVRKVNEPKWTLTKSGKGTEMMIIQRLDVSIAEYQDGKQGNYIIPFLSGRSYALKGSFGERYEVAVGVDNDSKSDFKDIVLSDELYDTVVTATSEALDNFVEGAKGTTVYTNTKFIKNAVKLQELARSVKSQPQVNESTISNAEEIAKIIG